MSIELLLTAVVLFAAAIVLLTAELFVPAHGLLLAFSCALAVAGVIACFAVSWVAGFCGVAVVLLAAPVVLFAMVRYYPKSPVGRRIVLRQPDPGSIKGLETQTAELSQMVGKTGVAISTLRPAGTCDFAGRHIACVSEGIVINAGSAVIAIGVSGMQLLVRTASP